MSKFDIPVHELTRRPGNTSSLQIAIDLDDAMGQGVASVPAGTDSKRTRVNSSYSSVDGMQSTA